MIHAQVSSPWAGNGQSIATAYRPKTHDDYTLASCVQLGPGNPPAPVLVEITCAEVIWTAIRADPAYAVGVVQTAPL